MGTFAICKAKLKASGEKHLANERMIVRCGGSECRGIDRDKQCSWGILGQGGTQINGLEIDCDFAYWNCLFRCSEEAKSHRAHVFWGIGVKVQS